MTRLETLIEEIPKYLPGADLDLLTRAYHFSEHSHQGQQRASGEPYLSHPLEVARLLVDFKMDVTTVIAGLLHDVLEDTEATKADLQREFGVEIADLVDGVTKIGKLAFSSREERQAENFRKMLVAMARDIRVLMIKLADRLHNMRTLEFLPPDKARKIAQETLDIYAPLAHRLGMAKVKAELEDLALRMLHPGDYQELMRRVAKRRLERESEINQLIAILQEQAGRGVGVSSRASRAAPSTSTRSGRRCTTAGASSTRSTTSPPCASSPTPCATATAPSASSTRSGSPSPAGSRTSSRCPRSTCTSRSTRPSSGPRATCRDPDPHPRDAPDRRGRHRRPLALQGEEEGRPRPLRRGLPLAAPAPRVPEGGRRPEGVPRDGAARPLPRRGVRLHPEGRREGPAGRARRPSTSRTPSTPRWATTASAPRSTASSCRSATRSARATSSRW